MAVALALPKGLGTLGLPNATLPVPMIVRFSASFDWTYACVISLTNGHVLPTYQQMICFTPGWPRAKGTGHSASRGASGVPAQLSCQTSPVRITAALMYIWLLEEQRESKRWSKKSKVKSGRGTRHVTARRSSV